MHALAAMIGADRPGRAILSEDAELKLKQAIIAAAASTLVTTHTIVVGAGVAGLRAAADLAENGVGVAVLEASDSVGGVVQSDPAQCSAVCCCAALLRLPRLPVVA